MIKKIFTIATLLVGFSLSIMAADLKAFQNDKGKWGYMDLDENIVITPKYDSAEEFIDGKAVVSSKQKYGIIDATGVEIVPVKYASIGAYNKYGLAQINLGGKVEEGVVSGGKVGYINQKGEIVLPAKYDEIGFFDKTNTAWVKSAKKYGLINASGTLISEVKYSGHGTFADNGICWVNVGGVEQSDNTVNGGLWGYLNANGEELVAPKYSAVRVEFVEGISWVKNSKGKFAYVKEDGELLNGEFYDDISDVFSCGAAWVKDDNKVGYIKIDGQPLTEIKYDGAHPFHEGMAAIGMKESKNSPVKWGYLGIDGTEIFAPQFESVIIKSNYGRAFVQQNGKWAFVDDKGNILTDYEFTVVSEIREGGRALVSTSAVGADGEIRYNYILNSNGKKVNSVPYEHISFFSEGFSLVQKQGGYYCWIDESGKEYFNNKYTQAGVFSEGLAFASKNGRGVYIDKKGTEQVVIDTNLKVVGCPFENGYALVSTENNLWGCIDKNGVFVVPLALASQEDAKYLLDNFYEAGKEPLGAKHVRLIYLYKGANKCSIGDVVPNNLWAY